MKKIILTGLGFLLIISCQKTKEKNTLSTPETTTLIPPVQTKTNTIETPTPSSLIKKEKEKEIIKKIIPIKKEKKVSLSIKDTKTANSKKETAPIISNTTILEKPIIEKAIPTTPNHTTWSNLTKNYVSINGKVNYTGFKNNSTKIKAYLTHLANTPPTKEWSKNEKLAYWFNLYNASTVQLIVENYPIKSILDINNGKPWDKKFINSGENTYSLNQIENAIVRPNFNEPRLHVAFNCAAISCPRLLNDAFLPSQLNHQLNKLSKDWINDATKNSISENEIKISKIFEWYAVDFRQGITSFINTYSNTKTNTEPKISYLEYNWGLNQ